jgi:hypothetical protein
MKIIKDDIWKYRGNKTPICVTTNGFVKKNGECVMGRGIANQTKLKFPEFPALVGEKIRQFGNKVFYYQGYDIITFPVKHNWWEMADLELIKQSVIQLLEIIDYFDTVYMTKPGCHNGKLDWETQVKPILEEVFGDTEKIIICDLD